RRWPAASAAPRALSPLRRRPDLRTDRRCRRHLPERGADPRQPRHRDVAGAPGRRGGLVMDEQRLERALRQGPPFATAYVPASLALDDASVGRERVAVTRLVLTIAVMALLLAALVAGLVAVGTQNPHLPHGPGANGWIAFVRGGDIYLVREGTAAHRII